MTNPDMSRKAIARESIKKNQETTRKKMIIINAKGLPQ